MIQYVGYALSFVGVSWYNYAKLQAMKQEGPTPAAKADEESKPLLGGEGGKHQNGGGHGYGGGGKNANGNGVEMAKSASYQGLAQKKETKE